MLSFNHNQPKNTNIGKNRGLKLNIKDALSQRLNVLSVSMYDAVGLCLLMGQSKLYTEDTIYISKGFVEGGGDAQPKPNHKPKRRGIK